MHGGICISGQLVKQPEGAEKERDSDEGKQEIEEFEQGTED